MAVCPKDGCSSTEFKVEKIKAEGYIPKIPVIVCATCGAIISLTPNAIEPFIHNITAKIK
jgi:hypothetical protein